MSESDGLLLDVSEEVKAQLCAVSVDIGYGRTRTLYDLILGWAAHIRKLREESTASQVANPLVWNEHDFVAALFIRDFVESGVAELSRESEAVVGEQISRIDSEYLSFTQDGYRALLARVADVDTSVRGWWWDRVPISGAVLEGINRNYRS